MLCSGEADLPSALCNDVCAERKQTVLTEEHYCYLKCHWGISAKRT